MSHHRLILLGTGTDVGKTYVGCQIARAWRDHLGPVLGLKPVESGFDDSRVGDAAELRKAASFSPLPLYRFAPPISPHLAARQVETEIQLQRVVHWVREEEDAFFGRNLESTSPGTLTIVETAGGVFSPLSASATNLDLLRLMGDAKVILIAPDALGVLHDVQATLRAMAPTRVDLLVLSESRPRDASTGSNQAELEGLVFLQLGENAPRSPQVFTMAAGASGDALVKWIRSS